MSDSSGFDFINRTLSGEDRSGEIDEGRRNATKAAGATAAALLTGGAGCLTQGSQDKPSTTTATETPPTTEPATTTEEEPTTTQEPVTAEDLRRKRAQLSEAEKQVQYQQAVPNASGYDLDMNRVLEENDSLEEQIFDIYMTVGNQTHTRTQGNHKIVHALNQHPEIGWEQKNLTNIVTRYNSRPGEQIIVNYEEDGNRQADGMIDGQTPGDHYTIQNIPDSELTNGNLVNFLVTDMGTWEESMEKKDWGPENYEALQINMQSVIPGVIGPSVNANRHNGRDATDHHILFNEDALSYISESYKDSAEAMLDVTVDALEIDLATEEVRNKGKYVELGADEDGLYTDEIYEEAKGEEVMRQPVEL